MHNLQRIVFPASLEFLNECLSFVLRHAKQYIESGEELFHVKLSLEEIVSNVINHAYPDGQQGLIDVGCGLGSNREFCIQVVDSGKKFNPLNMEEPDVTLDIDEREIGGLGIFFARNFVDDINYRRVKNRNVLTLSYSLDGKGAALL